MKVKFSRSALILLITNIFLIFLAVFQGWSLATVVWVYWFQSVFIGIFNFKKILSLKDFSAKGFRINKKPAEKMSKKFVKYYTAYFFLFHYGIFHLGYFLFLTKLMSLMIGEMIFVLIGAGLFLLDHGYSYKYNYEKDLKKNKKPNIGRMMFKPYVRIVPLHIFIVMGIFLIQTTIGLIFFLSLKTGADLIMHMVEHS